MDISIYSEITRREHLAIVLGEQDAIHSIVKRLGCNFPIHMSTVRPKEVQDDILSKLDLHSKKVAVFCVRIERNPTVKMIQKKTKKNISSKRIQNAFDYSLFHHLRSNLIEYLATHKRGLDDISFQCDSDCQSLIKNNALTPVLPDEAHMVADIVAWGNSHNVIVNGVIELDVVDDIVHHLLKMFKK